VAGNGMGFGEFLQQGKGFRSHAERMRWGKRLGNPFFSANLTGSPGRISCGAYG